MAYNIILVTALKVHDLVNGNRLRTTPFKCKFDICVYAFPCV